jgi:uncharacterized BrkB/YihY/UPF0761 family membrane protein
MFKMSEFIGHADTLLESAWRERKWSAFIRVWLMSSLALLVICFVTPFVFPGLLYNVVALIFGIKLLPLSELWNLAAPFAVMVGAFTLIFTVPVMLLKQLSGEFNSP